MAAVWFRKKKFILIVDFINKNCLINSVHITNENLNYNAYNTLQNSL